MSRNVNADETKEVKALCSHKKSVYSLQNGVSTLARAKTTVYRLAKAYEYTLPKAKSEAERNKVTDFGKLIYHWKEIIDNGHYKPRTDKPPISTKEYDDTVTFEEVEFDAEKFLNGDYKSENTKRKRRTAGMEHLNPDADKAQSSSTEELQGQTKRSRESSLMSFSDSEMNANETPNQNGDDSDNPENSITLNDRPNIFGSDNEIRFQKILDEATSKNDIVKNEGQKEENNQRQTENDSHLLNCFDNCCKFTLNDKRMVGMAYHGFEEFRRLDIKEKVLQNEKMIKQLNSTVKELAKRLQVAENEGDKWKEIADRYKRRMDGLEVKCEMLEKNNNKKTLTVNETSFGEKLNEIRNETKKYSGLEKFEKFCGRMFDIKKKYPEEGQRNLFNLLLAAVDGNIRQEIDSFHEANDCFEKAMTYLETRYGKSVNNLDQLLEKMNTFGKVIYDNRLKKLQLRNTLNLLNYTLQAQEKKVAIAIVKTQLFDDKLKTDWNMRMNSESMNIDDTFKDMLTFLNDNIYHEKTVC